MAWIRWRDWPLSQQMLVLAAMVAVAVGLLGAGVLGWQGLVSARAQVAREADQSLALVDSTLHLAYQSAVARGRLAIPAVYKAYGGEPRLAEAVATPTGADAAAPTLMAGGEAMNNRLVPLELLRDYTGAETAVLARNGQGRWIALASLRKHDDGSPRLGVPYAADDPVVRVAEAGQPADLLVQRAGRWNVMSIQPLRDPAGRVYGAISARVDVDDDIRRLLQHLGELRPIGGMGQLVVMSPHEKPGTWTYLVHPAFQGRTIDALAPADRAVVETLLPQPQGFIRANFANNRTATLMGWRQVTRWGWVVFAVGPEPALMATAYRTLMLQAALLLGTGLVIAGLIAWRMRGALRPVGSVAQDLVGLGEGDLSRPPPPARLASRNEVQVLFGAFGRTHAGLLRTVRAVRAGVDEIHGAAGEIAAGNEDLSRRTEAQAASLEQTAASMEQLASTVKQNADNARQASQLAAGAREVARRGGAAVGTVVATMQGISTSSRQIADIVGVIDSIAFQTNILALNAAVEAARAGDQGKGFAVVAGEVRTLAQRSATAAQEIRTLIGEAGGRVEAGVGQVEQAGATMQDIIAAVQRVADILGEITAASQEQASGIDQVNQAVAQMDSVTQQNAALVEQASAAAASLQTQAGHLRETVAAFRLSTAEAGRPAAAGPMTLVLT